MAQESVFEFVEEDNEFEALSKVFEALLDEMDIDLEWQRCVKKNEI